MLMAHALARTAILYMAFHCTPAFLCESFEAPRTNYIGDFVRKNQIFKPYYPHSLSVIPIPPEHPAKASNAVI